MTTKILNGGIELGLFEAVGYENLSEKDRKRMKYLLSLPKNEWIALDKDGQKKEL